MVVAREKSELAQQMRGLRQGDHSCLIYETPEQQRAAMIPFYLEGLARGERCLWIADDRTVDEVKSFLFDAGIDIADATRKGVFTVLTKRETYLSNGVFDPNVMITLLAEKLKETAALGFSGLRSSGEMTWALGNEKGCERAIEYEALLNDFFPGKKFIGICQYNRKRFPPSLMLNVLKTHHYAIIGDKVCPNLYFEPTEMSLGRSSDQARFEWQVSQLSKAREATQTLERAIESREAFFSVASHELKTPLAALKLQLEILLMDTSSPSDPERTALVRSALTQTRKLIELSESLLDATQMSAKGLTLERSNFDLATMIREVTAEYSEGSGSVLQLNLVDVEGLWDSVRLRQVLNNLLSNAFKYGERKPVEVHLSLHGSVAQLVVRDYGIGIAKEDQVRIFGPFERAVSERNYSGFGVGLWVAQKIIEAHGGRIHVESSPGNGATFLISLPTRE